MSPELIGRAHPVELLRAEVDGLLSGHGGLVFVTGEAGIGKTSLLGEVAAEARQRGVRVLSGSCWQDGGAPGYWPWVQVVRNLARSAGTEEWSEAAAAAGHDIGPLLGEYGTAEDVTDGARFRLHDAFTTLLLTSARDQPILVVLEDLHWADPASLRLLDFLVRHAWFEPILVVASYRDVELDAPGHPLRPLLTPMLSRATTVGLTGLDATEVGALIARTTGTEPSAELADAVHRRTGGNPFFIEQTAQLGPSVTSGVRDAVAQRLALLPDGLDELLTLCSTLGHDFETALLASIAGAAPDELDRLLEPSVTARLVTRAGAGRYAFVHDLVRESLYRRQSETGRRETHAAIVRGLRANPSLGGRPGLLGYHAERAVPVISETVAADLLLAAARDARSRLAAEEAVTHYRSALNLRGGADATVMLELADQLDQAGELNEARETFRALTAMGRRTDDAVLVATAALGQQRLGNPDPYTLTEVELLDDARRRLDAAPVEHPALAARVLAAAAMARTHQSLHVSGGPELSVQAVARARAAGDDETLGWCLLARHDAEWRPGTATERVELLDELTAAARRAGHLELESLASFLRSVALLEQGSPAAYREFAGFEALAERTRLPRHRYLALSRRGGFAALHGDFARARQLFDDALVLGVDVEEGDARRMWRDQMWAAHLLCGDVENATASARAANPEDPFVGFLEGVTSAYEGDVEKAHARLAEIERYAERMPRQFRPAWLVYRTQLAVVSGDDVLCEQTRAELLPVADSWAVFAGGGVVWGSMRHWLAELDLAQGRWDDAVTGFDTAVGSACRFGARPWVVMARARLAVALRSRGDFGRAASEAASAREEAAELGMSAMLDRVLPAPERPADPAAASESVFRLDGEVWTVRFAGRTAHVKDAKGMRDLHSLLTRPGKDVPAVELLTPGDGREPARLGADPMIDDAARSAYRARLRVLEAQINDALDRSADRRAAQLDRERDALLDELRRATGLSGRSRRLGDQTERARQTVTARIRDTLKRLRGSHPELAEHLDASVSTGAHCRYHPVVPPPWLLS
ncbi:ATP-binding protein [Pseudonocardia spinosispora]|uniref:ATP-binding protein n=1 Tax=Pseudonocardia spinosispora TaxID=103441 RepID=UPI0004040BCB|nr:AAA family ATPase [Pseudonocardia spinosispora]